MNFLFDLWICHMTDENCRMESHMGTFETEEDATAVMKTLMSHGGPFSEPCCEGRIEKVEMIGESAQIDYVYRFYGQNIDTSFEGDMIVSGYYADKSTAINEWIKAKKETPRQIWDMQTFKIRKSDQ